MKRNTYRTFMKVSGLLKPEPPDPNPTIGYLISGINGSHAVRSAARSSGYPRVHGTGSQIGIV